MDRLTLRDENKNAYSTLGTVQQCMDRLAQYEDTNLTPEEIDSMVASFVALTAMDYGKDRFFQQPNGIWYDRDRCDYISTSKMILRSYLTLEPYVSETI